MRTQNSSLLPHGVGGNRLLLKIRLTWQVGLISDSCGIAFPGGYLRGLNLCALFILSGGGGGSFQVSQLLFQLRRSVYGAFQPFTYLKQIKE